MGTTLRIESTLEGDRQPQPRGSFKEIFRGRFLPDAIGIHLSKVKRLYDSHIPKSQGIKQEGDGIPMRHTFNTIVGRFTGTRETTFACKRYVRQILTIDGYPTSSNLGQMRALTYEITFFWEGCCRHPPTWQWPHCQNYNLTIKKLIECWLTKEALYKSSPRTLLKNSA